MPIGQLIDYRNLECHRPSLRSVLTTKLGQSYEGVLDNGFQQPTRSAELSIKPEELGKARLPYGHHLPRMREEVL